MGIPYREHELASWAAHFSSSIAAAPATYRLGPGDAAAIAAVVDPFTAALAAYTPETRTRVAVAAKKSAKRAMLAVVRPFYRMIQSDASVAPADKSAAGIEVLDGRSGEYFRATSPSLIVLPTGPGVHKIRYYDYATPTARRKPPKTVGLMLYRRIGVQIERGTDGAIDGGLTFGISQMECVGLLTRINHELLYNPADRGKHVTYMANWISTRGKPGPPSNTVTLAVP